MNRIDRHHFLFAMIAQGDGTECRPYLTGLRRHPGGPIAALLDYVQQCPKATPRELAEKYAEGCFKAQTRADSRRNRQECLDRYRQECLDRYRHQYNRMVRNYELDSYPAFPTCFFVDNTWYLNQYQPLFEQNCSHSLEEAGDLLASMLSFTKTHIIALLSYYDCVPVLFGFNEATSQVIEQKLMTMEKRFIQLVETGTTKELGRDPSFALIGAHSRSYRGYPEKANDIARRFTNAFRLRSLPLTERRSLLSDIFIDMTSVELAQVPNEKLLLVFCVGYRWSGPAF